MKLRGLFICAAIMFSSAALTARAQQPSSRLEKIASCGPNTLYRRFAARPEVLPGEGGVHIRNPNSTFDQEGEAKVLLGDVYLFNFQGWNISQSFPGGKTEALALFQHHCSARDFLMVIEKK